MHGMIWIDKSPTISSPAIGGGRNFEESNKDFLEFIDRTISCRIPNQPNKDMTSEEHKHYTEMKELINRVRHKCKENCFKRNSEKCRYGFPKPVADETWIEVTQQFDDQGKPAREDYEIHLQRNANERNINNYNPFFLKV